MARQWTGSFVGMLKRKQPADWHGLSSVDEDLASEVAKLYHSPVQFDGAFEDKEGAAELVVELMGDKKTAAEVERIAEALWEWRAKRLRRGPSLATVLQKQIPSMPVRVQRPAVDIHQVFEEVVATTPAVAIAQLQRAVKVSRAAGSREDLETQMRERWALQLVAYIKEAKLPCASRMEALGDSNHLWLRIFGNRRGKTLRNRARAWRPFREWLMGTYGVPWPQGAGQVLKYLEERHAVASLGKTVPRSIMASLSLLETIGMVSPEDRCSEDQLLLESLKSWTMELESGGPAVKPAPMLPVAAFLVCEMVVCRPVYELGLRFTAFTLLLMTWASLRCDDVQNIDPESLKLSQVGLRFVLKKTKTSGPGRKVGELHAFVARTVGLSGYDWLGEGYKLLSASALSWARDFLCPAFSAEWDTPAEGFLDAEGLALQLRRLLKHLPTPVRQQGVWKVARELLFPGEMANFWTGHSARHVATSLAAALGVSKDRRDYLGRWAYAQHGSQDYVLTSRQVVQGVQNFICKCLLVGHPDGGYTEEELFCTMRSYAEALHLAGDEIVKACSVLQWDDVGATWKLGGNFPSFVVSPDRVRAAAGNMGADLPGPYQDFEQEEDKDDAPYFITISRKGFRRLHLSKKCAVRRENCLETLPIFKLSEGIADAVCKLCKPKVESAEGSSTSGSEDTQVENPAEPEEPEGLIPNFVG